MVSVESYTVAVILCFITMLCWGSWANMQKLAGQQWRFPLFYWDYSIGVLLLALIFAFTLGSMGGTGRAFLPDLMQADGQWLGSAFLGGVIFNLSNILLVAAIEIAGMSVAFPVGVGLALVLGVITTYLATGDGNVPILAAGVGAVVIAIVLDALAYGKMAAGARKTPVSGIVLSVVAGVLMGWFYSFVARSMGTLDPVTLVLTPGKLSAYTAIVLFSLGLFVSSFLWNGLAMRYLVQDPPIAWGDYFRLGNARLHAIGILGGVIWSVGMALSILASTKAGAALSYGLGQGATMVGAAWGVFVWKEFKGASSGVNGLLAAMFVFYLLGLGILVASRL